MDISSMSLEAKIGQLMMFGFAGKEVPPFLRDFITQRNLGGIIHFSRNVDNPQQLGELNKEFQRLAVNSKWQTQLFVSVDQEGGSVARLTSHNAVAPSNMALGATEDVAITEDVCGVAGKELRAVGVNMNLAPVLDVNNNPQNPVIGVRSYGENPSEVSRLGSAAIRGFQQHIAAVAKHFPGHGDTAVDSHLALPTINHARKRLDEVELVPFKQAIAQGVAGIMTAHVYFPAIDDKQGVPATLSPAVLTGLLRDELGYNGLILTDCMEMQAIASSFGTVEAAVMTIEAGADMVLISHTPKLQEEAFHALMKAVQTGRISEERIDQSVRRIIRTKQQFGLLDNAVFIDASSVGCQDHLAVMQNAIDKSLTLVKGDDHLPLTGSILVIESKPAAANIAEDVLVGTSSLSVALSDQGLTVETLFVDLELADQEIAAVVEKAAKYDRVVLVTQDAHRNPSQARLVNKLNDQVNLVVVGTRTPYELVSFPQVPVYLAAYGNRSQVWTATAKVLTGKMAPQGRLGVTIPGMFLAGHGLTLDE